MSRLLRSSISCCCSRISRRNASRSAIARRCRSRSSRFRRSCSARASRCACSAIATCARSRSTDRMRESADRATLTTDAASSNVSCVLDLSDGDEGATDKDSCCGATGAGSSTNRSVVGRARLDAGCADFLGVEVLALCGAWLRASICASIGVRVELGL